MRRRALLAVPLLVACVSADATSPAATSPAATSPAAAPAPATTSRLETRLTVEEATRLGAPVRLRLELVNATGEAWSFDGQQAGINGSLEVTGPDGATVPYVGPSCQTCGGPELLPSGETAVLFSGLDLGGQYLLDRPGRYTVRYAGRGVSVDRGPVRGGGVLWDSKETVDPCEVTFELAPGEAPRGARITRALLSVAPEGWWLTADGTSWALVSTGGSGLKSDAQGIRLREGAPAVAGEVPLGRVQGSELFLSATPGAATLWPDYQARIEAALRAE